MRVEELGDGNPEFAVVGGVHGDEPCGKKAIENFLNSDYEVQKPVKLIIANEKALEKDSRYTDVDLNRSFPGDKNSDKYEERLAAEIIEEVEGLNTLSLHSTQSFGEPFAAMSDLSEEKIELVRETGVEIVSYHKNEEIGCLAEFSNAVTVEAGYQRTEEAAKNSYRVLLNFLAANGVIDEEYDKSNPEVYKVYDTVEKADYKFTAKNFRKVKQGEKYAEKAGKALEADEDFHPVLMSTDGYKNIIGHKARKVEENITNFIYYCLRVTT